MWEHALAMPKAALDSWLNKDLPRLKGMVQGLGQLLRDQFDGEAIMCQNRYNGCVNFLTKCDNRLKVLIASLKELRNKMANIFEFHLTTRANLLFPNLLGHD
uniref:Uncharacterized protein n=1 Tax=Globodera rostochiensis TaxID=31243 RepID=A0A914H0Q7_GLORO